jgi:hypothetical protein
MPAFPAGIRAPTTISDAFGKVEPLCRVSTREIFGTWPPIVQIAFHAAASPLKLGGRW